MKAVTFQEYGHIRSPITTHRRPPPTIKPPVMYTNGVSGKPVYTAVPLASRRQTQTEARTGMTRSGLLVQYPEEVKLPPHSASPSFVESYGQLWRGAADTHNDATSLGSAVVLAERVQREERHRRQKQAREFQLTLAHSETMRLSLHRQHSVAVAEARQEAAAEIAAVCAELEATRKALDEAREAAEALPTPALQNARDMAAAQKAIDAVVAHQAEVQRLNHEVFERDRLIERMELAAGSGAGGGANGPSAGESALQQELVEARAVADAVRKHARLYAEQQAVEHARQLAEAKQDAGGAASVAAAQTVHVASAQSQLVELTTSHEEGRAMLSAARARVEEVETAMRTQEAEATAAMGQLKIDHARQLQLQAEAHRAEIASTLAEARTTALAMAQAEVQAEAAAHEAQLLERLRKLEHENAALKARLADEASRSPLAPVVEMAAVEAAEAAEAVAAEEATAEGAVAAAAGTKDAAAEPAEPAVEATVAVQQEAKAAEEAKAAAAAEEVNKAFEEAAALVKAAEDAAATAKAGEEAAVARAAAQAAEAANAVEAAQQEAAAAAVDAQMASATSPAPLKGDAAIWSVAPLAPPPSKAPLGPMPAVASTLRPSSSAGGSSDNMLSPSPGATVGEIFRRFDANGDGVLEANELHAALAHLSQSSPGVYDLTTPTAAQMLRTVLENSGGRVSKQEWRVLLKTLRRSTSASAPPPPLAPSATAPPPPLAPSASAEPTVGSVWRRLDNGSGVLDFAALCAALDALKIPRDNPHAARAITQCQSAGRVSQPQFRAAVKAAKASAAAIACSPTFSASSQASALTSPPPAAPPAAPPASGAPTVGTVFRHLDTDGDSLLTPQQVRAGMQHLGVPMDTPAAHQAFAAMQASGAPGVSLAEFRSLCKGLKAGGGGATAATAATAAAAADPIVAAPKAPTVGAMYRRFVNPATGLLDVANVPAALSGLDISMSTPTAEQAMSALESSRSAGVSMEDFRTLCKGLKAGGIAAAAPPTPVKPETIGSAYRRFASAVSGMVEGTSLRAALECVQIPLDTPAAARALTEAEAPGAAAMDVARFRALAKVLKSAPTAAEEAAAAKAAEAAAAKAAVEAAAAKTVEEAAVAKAAEEAAAAKAAEAAVLSTFSAADAAASIAAAGAIPAADATKTIEQADAARAIDAAVSREWLYIDQDDLVQGPFGETEILEWYLGGYLPPELMVRIADGPSREYMPLSAHVGEGGVLEQLLQALIATLAAEGGDGGTAEAAASEAAAAEADAATAQPPTEPAAPGDWVYLDHDLNVQGPFPEGHIFEWYLGGLLPDDLSLKPFLDDAAPYTPLETLVGPGGALESRLSEWQAAQSREEPP